jgi:hypothetical protein
MVIDSLSLFGTDPPCQQQHQRQGDRGTRGNFSAKWDFAGACPEQREGTATDHAPQPYTCLEFTPRSGVDGQPQAAVLTAYIPSLRSGQAWAVHTK